MTEPTSPLPAASPAPRQRASPTPPPRGRGHSRGRHPTLHLPAWGLVCRQHGLSGERVLIGMLSDGFGLGFRKDTDICLKANCLASFLSLSLQGVGGQGCSASCLVLHSREGLCLLCRPACHRRGPDPAGPAAAAVRVRLLGSGDRQAADSPPSSLRHTTCSAGSRVTRRPGMASGNPTAPGLMGKPGVGQEHLVL